MIRDLVFGAAACLLALGGTAQAADQATPDEAKALAVRSAEHLKASGPQQAFADFNKAEGSYRDRDLYVFVVDESGKTLAHANAALIGRVTIDLKDVEGKPFVRDMIAIKDAGWVERRWPNPVTKAVAPKTSYVIQAGDYWLGVGAYKK